MKKLVRNLFAVIAATALVGSLASCADSDAEDPFATTSTNANSAGGNGGAGNGGGANNGSAAENGNLPAGYKAKAISFDVSTASTNAEKQFFWLNMTELRLVPRSLSRLLKRISRSKRTERL